MKKVFKSKVDIALPILFMTSSIPAFVIGIREKDWVVFAILIGTFGLVFYLLYDTNYTISKNNLKVHSGFIVNKNIAIADIKSVKKTDSILSAPASSLTDRIEVNYGIDKSIIISPLHKEDFVNELKKQNADILVNI